MSPRKPLPALALLPLATALSRPAVAMDPERPIARYALDTWTTAQGLPRNTVEAVVETRDGQLWFATSDGLARLEGGRFGVFAADAFPGVTSLPATALAEGADPGVLWLGIESGGLLRFDSRAGTHRLLREADGLCSDAVTALHLDAAGGLWVGTRAALACRYADGAFLPVPLAGLHAAAVLDIVTDLGGAVYLAAGTEALLYAPRPGVELRALPGLPGRATAVAVDPQGAVYAGTSGSGVFLYHWDEGAYVPVGDGPLRDLRVRQLLSDGQGSLWIGTSTQGVFRVRLGRSDEVLTVDHLDAALVTDLLLDREGSLWISTQGDGVLRLADLPISTLSARHGLGEEKVWALLPIDDGGLLVGTAGGGIFEVRGDRAQPWPTAALLGPRAIVVSMSRGSDGMVWAAVYDRGVARFDAKGGLVLGPDQGLASDRPSVVQAARDGRVFVGHHRGGIDVVLGRSVAPHERSADLPRAAVTALLETADGALWVGTQGGGLAILRGADLRALTTTDGLADDNVNGLYEAADGAIWVATAGGLSRVLGDAVVNIGRSQGLPAGAVYDVLQDRGGDFWLSTDVGVISVERESVDRLLAGGVGRIESRHFGTAEGMLTAECVGGTQENMAKDRDGTIYVATTRGVALVSPSMAPSPPSAPRSLLSALWVGGRRAPLPSEGEASVLGRGPTDVALEYLSTAHLRQSDVRFRYRLEGLDEDWVEARHQRIARYAKVPPGRYRFEVEAATGVEWGEPAALSFRVLGLPWRSPWPWALAVVLACGLVVAGVVRSLAAQRRRQADLEAALEAKARELRDAALVDPLTGLRNRRFVTEVVLPEVAAFLAQRLQILRSGTRRRTIAEAGVFGVFLFDIDHFKRINDTLGHEAGDRMLQQFSFLLRRSVRQDDFVIRWGGEEFLVVLRFTDRDHLDTYARRVREQVEQTTFLVADAAGGSLKKTTSIGYISLPFFDEQPEGLEFEQALLLADEALYKAKEGGRNRAVRVVSTGQIPEGADLRQMVRSLDWAIERGYVRLEVYAPGS